MKISDILLEAKKKKHKHMSKKHNVDMDTDDNVVDADLDSVPHIMMQLRKAVDVDGDYPITFQNGKKAKLSMDQITNFVTKYMFAKPDEKEQMQNMAASSIEGFMSALEKPSKPKFSQKIKGTRYMTGFAGDQDEK